ncbi:MAG: glycerophosphodiester phosphodiesterase [Clostridiaceae bacterium]|jgi:glycerophosphoryl diester phosphodiesterase|nr:glycerophosphodiester phosphodiesterase [Clostridiaceae bacterium]
MMPVCYAHRGFSAKYPENTMEAFREAVKAGAQGVELDVHLSQDGVPVILHDESLLRTAGIDRNIETVTTKELQNICVGTHIDHTVPTLEEYLRFARTVPQFLTNIELKTSPNPYPGIEEKVLRLVSQYGLESRVLYSSFNHFTLRRIKKINADAKIGVLTYAWICCPKNYCLALQATAYHPHASFLQTSDGEKCAACLQKAGIDVNVWTVDDEKEMQACCAQGVTSIITNRPDVFAKWRGRFQ